MTGISRKRIVIIGGSFGGLNAAYELRRLLPGKSHQLILISREDRFVFIPSLPWVTMGHQTLPRISFELAKPLAAHGIEFLHDTITRIEPESGKVHLPDRFLDYDHLIIATGHRSANEAVPGLGPFDGPGHSLMSTTEAQEAGESWARFLLNPGPVVVGCAPGASCIGPAYEFAFEIDHELKRRRMRHRVPITFITPEPFLGHFGVGGMGKARQFLEGEFEQRDIRYLTSAAVSRITDQEVVLADGKSFESKYSLVIPPLGGVKAVAESPGLANPKGFVPVDDGFRHKSFPNVYAVGVAVAYPPVDVTPVPVNFPKTGHMTEQMAKAAARNIVVDFLGGERVERPPFVQCIMDMGASAARMLADPVRPPRNRVKMSHGRRWLWAKRLYAPYYLWKMKTGRSWLP